LSGWSGFSFARGPFFAQHFSRPFIRLKSRVSTFKLLRIARWKIRFSRYGTVFAPVRPNSSHHPCRPRRRRRRRRRWSCAARRERTALAIMTLTFYTKPAYPYLLDFVRVFSVSLLKRESPAASPAESDASTAIIIRSKITILLADSQIRNAGNLLIKVFEKMTKMTDIKVMTHASYVFSNYMTHIRI